MNVRFIGENIGKFEDLVIGGVYTLIGNDVWIEDYMVIVRVTAEEGFKNFEIAN